MILMTGFFISILPSCQKEVMTEVVVETDTITDTLHDTVTIDLHRGLIAYYNFTGNTNDSSGNNKHGNPLNGLAYTTDAHNAANKAANFDGIDDYINIPDATNYFAPPKMSVSFQFNLRDVNTRSAMLCKSAFTTPSSVSWSAGIPVNGVQRFTYSVANGDNPCGGEWGTANGLGYEMQYSTPLQNNKWYQVTIIFNLGVQMTYFDGELVQARVGSYSFLNQCADAPLRIGGWWQNDIISINGKIDELRIYNRILAENEIEKLADEIN
jgi:hypothetical protein